MDIKSAFVKNQNPEVENQSPVNEQESTLIDTPQVPPLPADQVVSPKDPSFNCEPCKGEGLIGDPAGEHSICANCNGTGKVGA